MERVKTNIPGFDKLLKGGFPKGSIILLSGTPATGKTIFALQYLYNGVMYAKEKGLFVTFEEKSDRILDQASQFGWDLGRLLKNGSLTISHIPTGDIDHNTASRIIKMAKSLNVKRLVVDSVTTLSINVPNLVSDFKNISEHAVKRFVYRFISSLRTLNEVTSLVVSQTTDEASLSSDEVSEFICDGILHITYESLGGKYSRSLLVRKMRQVENDEDIHPLEIGKKGIVIHSIE